MLRGSRKKRSGSALLEKKPKKNLNRRDKVGRKFLASRKEASEKAEAIEREYDFEQRAGRINLCSG